MARKARTETVAWGGFSDDILHRWNDERGDDRLAVYATRASAKRNYEDVRRVLVTEAPKRKRRKP